MAGNMINNIPSDNNIKTDFSSSQKHIKKVTVSTKSNNKISKIKTNKKIKATYDYQYDSYSNNDLSSKSNIYVNKLVYEITNALKDKLNDTEYRIYKQFLTGKKIRDIIDHNGNIKTISTISYEGDIIDSINSKIMEIKSSYVVHYDKVLLNSKIKEIITEKNGFDALVLENDDEYLIISACCDSESKEDVMAISYALLYQITGSDKIWSSLSSLLVNDKGKIGNFDVKELANGSKYYHRQRNSNIELIQRYVNKGKKLRLGGYSLGGGIMLDSYARLYYENPNKFQDTTLTLLNPFMTYLEIDSKKYTVQKQKEATNKIITGANGLKEFFSSSYTLVDAIHKADSNVLIYSTEGDPVSQFNNLTKVFQEQMVYLKGNQEINENINEITDVLDLVISEDSRHGLKGIDMNAFDHNGYLIETGNQITVNEIAGGSTPTNNLGIIVSTIIDKHLKKSVGNYINNLSKDEEWMRDDLLNMYFDLRHYLINNAGHYDIDSMVKCVSPSLTSLLKKGASKETSLASIPNFFIDQAKIENTLNEYVRTPAGKKKLRVILDSFMYENTYRGVDHIRDFITTIYYKTDIVNFIMNVISECEKGYNIGKSINNLPDNLEDKLSGKTL